MGIGITVNIIVYTAMALFCYGFVDFRRKIPKWASAVLAGAALFVARTVSVIALADRFEPVILWHTACTVALFLLLGKLLFTTKTILLVYYVFTYLMVWHCSIYLTFGENFYEGTSLVIVLRLAVFAAISFALVVLIRFLAKFNCYPPRDQDMPLLLIPSICGLFYFCIFSSDSSDVFLMRERGGSAVVMALLLFVSFLYRRVRRMEAEKERFGSYATALTGATESVREKQEEVKSFNHRVNQHALVVLSLSRQLAETQDAETAAELERYVQKIDGIINPSQTGANTGSALADIILGDVERRVNELGIRTDFVIRIPSRFNFDYYDLSVLLGNALENALEACIKVPESKRYIRAETRIQGNLLFVEVANSYEGLFSIEPSSRLPSTTKLAKQNHGIGLQDIQRCAAKYNGRVDVQTKRKDDMQEFCLRIVLQAPQNQVKHG